MYESFFNLHRRPFSATPDPSCVYHGGSIQTVIDELVICLERGEGIAVLTAPAGLGKTLLCENLLQQLDGEFITIFLRHADFRSSADLLRTLLIELGKEETSKESEQELRLQLIGALTELRGDHKLLAVICDEAHQLSDDVLEELRRLVDHADHGVPWCRLMLAGQLELEEKLANPQLSALNQRLRAHLSLSPLSAQESLDYLDYRITWAGGRIEEVFHPDALTAIIDAADGNPRCLNQLCDHVLLLGYVAEQRPATPDLVHEALIDLQHLPLTWNVRNRQTSGAGDHPRSANISSPQAASSAVEFGDHLPTWESTPTFAPRATEHPGDVWEFGLDADSSLGADAFGRVPEMVPSTLLPSESSSRTDTVSSDEVREEPVVDRYAAIDAGWPVDDLPSDPQSPTICLGSPAAESDRLPHSLKDRPAEPEVRLHSDILELATTTREAVGSPAFDAQPSAKDDNHWEEGESSPPVVSPDRPFRNLFTRLRRKQRGLE